MNASEEFSDQHPGYNEQVFPLSFTNIEYSSIYSRPDRANPNDKIGDHHATKYLQSDWVLLDKRLFATKGAATDAATQTLNTASITPGDDVTAWRGLIIQNEPTTESARSISVNMVVPRDVFKEVYRDISSFKDMAITATIRTVLFNKSCPDPLMPINWFKIDGENYERLEMPLIVEDLMVSRMSSGYQKFSETMKNPPQAKYQNVPEPLRSLLGKLFSKR